MSQPTDPPARPGEDPAVRAQRTLLVVDNRTAYVATLPVPVLRAVARAYGIGPADDLPVRELRRQVTDGARRRRTRQDRAAAAAAEGALP